MTWFKVDDGFWSHPKTATLSDAAMALWVRAGSYCCQHLTDGAVKRGSLRLLGEASAADELVSIGLWDATDDGWQFHDWSQYQPSREAVLDERASNAARQAVARNPDLRDAVKKRDGNNCRYCGQSVEWNNKRGGAGGTYDHVIPNGGSTFENLVVCCRGCNARKGRRTPKQAGMSLIQVEPESELNQDQVEGSSRASYPTRPDPTRPDPSLATDVAKEETTPAPKGARGRRIEAGWMPSQETIDQIRTEYPHITSEELQKITVEFIDYWIGVPGQRGLKLNWDATWRNRVREVTERRPRANLKVVNGASAVDEKVNGWLDMAAGVSTGRELE